MAQTDTDIGRFMGRRDIFNGANSKAWMRDADGSWADVNIASRLFNSKDAWRTFVDNPNYERISKMVDSYRGRINHRYIENLRKVEAADTLEDLVGTAVDSLNFK